MSTKTTAGVNPEIGTKTTASKMHLSTREMVFIGLAAAIFCVLAPMSIPIGPVPISLTNLVLYFALYILGTRSTLISYIVYLLLGLVGLPVFSGFTGGPGKLAGPTGGYLIGFLLTILIAGVFIKRFEDNRWMQLLGMILGTAAVYLLGTMWLSAQSGMTLAAATAAGVLPFLPGDAVKILLALFQGPKLKKRIDQIRHRS